MTPHEKLKEYGISETDIVEILAECNIQDEQCIDDKLEAKGYVRIFGTTKVKKVDVYDINR